MTTEENNKIYEAAYLIIQEAGDLITTRPNNEAAHRTGAIALIRKYAQEITEITLESKIKEIRQEKM